MEEPKRAPTNRRAPRCLIPIQGPFEKRKREMLANFTPSLPLQWAMRPLRLGLSGRNSRKIPERPRKRSQSVSWNSPREYPCTWAKLGLFGFLAFFPQFFSIFWPKHGLSKVKNAGFYSIPAGCSDHVFGKKKGECYYSPEFGQILLTAYSLFNAKCNDLSQGHFPPPKTL